MSSNKKVTIVANNIDGGVSTFLTQLSRLENKEFSLLSLKKAERTNLPKFSSISIFPKKKATSYYHLSFSDITYIFQELLWLKKEIEKTKPDSILAIDMHASLLVCFLKLLFFRKTKLIVSNRNNIQYTSAEKLSKVLQKILQLVGSVVLPKATVIICGSHGSTKSFQKFFHLNQSVKIITIPNSIDINQANYLATQSLKKHDLRYFKQNTKTVISIGRLVQQKDFETIIDAIAIVSKSIKNVRFIIIGDGPKRKLLESYIHKNQLSSIVFLLGWKKNIYPYLAASDIFILSSYYEGFSFVLLEALSQAVPVISTDAPFGPSEVLEKGKYGILTPIGNKGKMANAILTLLTNKSTYKHYAKQAKSRSLFYAEKKIMKSYERIL